MDTESAFRQCAGRGSGLTTSLCSSGAPMRVPTRSVPVGRWDQQTAPQLILAARELKRRFWIMPYVRPR